MRNSMQLCCNYQLIELLEKRENECIYFDSHSNCSVNRLQEISASLAASYSEYGITEKDILKNITVAYPNDLLALLANIISLERSTKSIKLIIIDSIPTFHKKTDYDTATKLQALLTLIQHLSYLSQTKECAIVVVNHLTTKEIDINYTQINYQLKKEFPFSFTKSLGVSFSSFIKLTLYLFQSTDAPQIIVHSAFSLDNPIVNFSISQNGFE